MGSGVDIRLLGEIEVACDGVVAPIASAKQRALLAALALRANQTVSAASLVDALWDFEPPPTGLHALHVHVSGLRKGFEPVLGRERVESMLVTRPAGYQLRVGFGELDSDRFERLVSLGRADLAMGDPKSALDRFERALGLWRGPPFGEVAELGFVRQAASRLEDLHRLTVEDRAEARLALGHHELLIGELEGLVDAEPLHERRWSQLVLALYRSGRQSDALRRYEQVRRLLRDELGVEPGPALQALSRAVLNHDPALVHPRTAASTAASPAALPTTRYARSRGEHIAYQIWGDGPIDLVIVPGFGSHLEAHWEEESLARFLRRLGRAARVVMFDRHGTGLSDRSSVPPGIDEQLADLIAVLDATATGPAVVFGLLDGGSVGLLLAARHAERVIGVITYEGIARFERAPDYPWGADPALPELFLTSVEAGMDADMLVPFWAPSRADDPEFISWFARYLRMGTSPGSAAGALGVLTGLDIRAHLAEVVAPVLVVHRVDDRVVDIGNARFLREHLPNARLAELRGEDSIIWAGDIDAIAVEIETFLATLSAP